ncbi:MAG TPA: DUF47 family protein [Gemmatimonadaceae bacterium]|jgi:predicted phosphate transport protein (TIGR00153 family)|nr:DUF47 family protein [Gemmatimonadaceae bacterium]
MFGRLIPHDEQFFHSFNELADLLGQAAQELVKLFDEPERAVQHGRAIKEIEHKADALTAAVNVRLNKTFITPFDREDIHVLVLRLDDVIDLLDGVARRYEMLHIHDVRPPARELARVLVQASEHLKEAVRCIRKPALVEEQVDAVKALEEEADTIYEQAMGALFANGAEPLEVMKWKEMFDTLERTTDYCMRVAQVLRSISLKNA